MTPEPCKWCGGRKWIVWGDEWHECLCVKDAELRPTDLTAETSSLRGRRDALRHEAGE